MPLIQVNAGPKGLELNQDKGALGSALRLGLGRHDGPVIIMIHGYKFAPGHPDHCPHGHILSPAPQTTCWKALSWPCALGLVSNDPEQATGIAFGWNARGTIWQAYRRAEAAGQALSELIAEIHRHIPGRDVHVLAHSLGVRVLLSALPHLGAGQVARAILLTGAEYSTRAQAMLDTPAGRTAEIFNITSRENDPFDFMFERLIAPPRRGDVTMSHGLDARSNLLTLQMDNPATLAMLRGAGFAISDHTFRICHWSSYLRPGVFELYRALLCDKGAWPLHQLRAVLPKRTDPRWSRLISLPARRVPLQGIGQRAQG